MMICPSLPDPHMHQSRAGLRPTKGQYPEVHCCVVACNGYHFILLISECRYHPSPHAIWQCFWSPSPFAHEHACHRAMSAFHYPDDVNVRHLVDFACSGTEEAKVSSHIVHNNTVSADRIWKGRQPFELLQRKEKRPKQWRH